MKLERYGKINPKLIMVMLLIEAVIIAAVVAYLVRTHGNRNSNVGKQFQYNLTRQRHINPGIINYKEQLSFMTGLKYPRNVAIDKDDNIYVAGDSSILIFTPTGKKIKSIKLNDNPHCLAIDNDGDIYVGMLNYVEHLDNNGNVLGKWVPVGPDGVFTSIAINKNSNNVFVADAGNRVVLHYNKAGALLGKIGQKDLAKNINGFVIPSPCFDLAIGKDGLLRIVNPGRHRIEAYTSKGDLEFSWGEAGYSIDKFCGCCNPANFAILTDGSFVTCEKGLTRVKIYSPEGKFVSVVAGPAQFKKHDQLFNEKIAQRIYAVLDVATDSKDRIIILDEATGDVRIFVKASKPASTQTGKQVNKQTERQENARNKK